MRVHPVLRAVRVCLLAAFPLLIQVACARAVSDDGFEPTLFSPDAEAPRTACVETRCPAPLATCPGEAPCTVDLSSDIRHCGSCDTICPRGSTAFGADYLCSEGQCRIACHPLRADCNGNPADGCETPTYSDPKNCGVCGNACKEGELCWKGACGCPSGFTQCGDDCKKLDSDNENCSACGMLCTAPKDSADPRWTCGPSVTPPNTRWTCSNSACTLLCKPSFEDCNNNFCGDGCEIDTSHDPMNCGGCGKQCAPGQWCKNGMCACPPGTEECDGECVDFKRDPMNCGSCGARCPGPAGAAPGQQSHGGPGCVDGECTYVCAPGYADCDRKIGNGCEAHLDNDQKNCGGCGILCNIAAGQPCVHGQCLTKPCVDDPIR